MLLSLNWLRDFVDLPQDVDPHALAERYTTTTAEVDGIHRVEVAARGLIAARVMEAARHETARHLTIVTLDVGGRTVRTVTAAPSVPPGLGLVYAPPGSRVASLGDIGSTHVAGLPSEGMILPGEALGMPLAAQEAVLLGDDVPAGQPLAADLFDDWLIEIDNKSITHRPDLWGHYGVARELAAMYGLPLKPLPLAPLEELAAGTRPEIEIKIADGAACRRYSGLMLTGVPTRPAPLWMQLRLGRVGMRPISGLVDLTNYVMAEIGQPMHAFDGDKVRSIEVAFASAGEVFRTLDDVERTLSDRTLMIKTAGRSIAVAGIMGGQDTEVSETTRTLLLESANFDGATIRRAAQALGMRTDASARFEKSLDPANTVLAIQRFVHLARGFYKDLALASRLSDAYPNPYPKRTIAVSQRHLARTIGRDVPPDEVARLLTPLGFTVSGEGQSINVEVPSFRGTTDVTIEADVIEEVARCIGYNCIEPAMPEIAARRFDLCAAHELEQRTIAHLCHVDRFNEIHGYIWYDSEWLARLGFEPGPCIELNNPAGAGLNRLRQTLMPGLLASLAHNRFYFDACRLLEVGSVFEQAPGADREYRQVGLILARRQRKAEEELFPELKGVLEGWAWQVFGRALHYTGDTPDAARPWEQPHRTATVRLGDRIVGKAGTLDLALRQRIDEHLAAWSVAWAELRLTGLESLESAIEPLEPLPSFPRVELDFSILTARARRFADVAADLAALRYSLLRAVRFVASYEGASIAPDQRSLTFRFVLGAEDRTLQDEDVVAFTRAFEDHVSSRGYTLRR